MIPPTAHIFKCQLDADGVPAGDPFDVAVVSYQAPDEVTSKSVWRALSDERTGERNISAWRASDLGYTEWFVHVCGQLTDVERAVKRIERVAGMQPFSFTEAEAWALVVRRHKTLIDEMVKAQQAGRLSDRVRQTAHFGTRRGAILSSDGEFHVRRVTG